MNIQHIEQGEASVLILEGRLDGTRTAEVERSFLELVSKGRKLFAFDLSGLTYISSAGLRVILVAAKKVKAEQGRIVFTNLTDAVREIFEMSGFLTILDIKSSRDEALAALSAV